MNVRISLLILLIVLLGACTNAPHDDASLAADTSFRDVDLQGHRGARGLLPENTIPSFKKALDLGVHTLEIDVVVSADSLVVVSHEPWFSSHICSTPDGSPIGEDDERSYNIFEMTYDSVRTFDCGSRGHPLFPDQEAMAAYKPRLDTTLATLESYAEQTGLRPPRYNIEIKSRPEHDGTFTPEPAVFARLVHHVIAGEGVRDRTIFQSFDPRSLQAMREIDGEAALALLVDNDLGLDANLARLGFTPDVYSPHQRLVDEALIRAVHESDMLVIPWTVNDPDVMRHLLSLGVDGIITDYPDRATAFVMTTGALP